LQHHPLPELPRLAPPTPPGLGWSVVATYVLLKLLGLFVPIRVSMQQELEGLDISQLGEALQ
jgi:ammonia channel protein AmtB